LAGRSESRQHGCADSVCTVPSTIVPQWLEHAQREGRLYPAGHSGWASPGGIGPEWYAVHTPHTPAAALCDKPCDTPRPRRNDDALHCRAYRGHSSQTLRAASFDTAGALPSSRLGAWAGFGRPDGHPGALQSSSWSGLPTDASAAATKTDNDVADGHASEVIWRRLRSGQETKVEQLPPGFASPRHRTAASARVVASARTAAEATRLMGPQPPPAAAAAAAAYVGRGGASTERRCPYRPKPPPLAQGRSMPLARCHRQQQQEEQEEEGEAPSSQAARPRSAMDRMKRYVAMPLVDLAATRTFTPATTGELRSSSREHVGGGERQDTGYA
jgi:hypothetical protein